MSQFNIGDRVRLKPDGSQLHNSWYFNHINELGTITNFYQKNCMRIVWDDSKKSFLYKNCDVIHIDIFGLNDIDEYFNGLLENI